LFFSYNFYGQTNYNSGDKELDTELAEINSAAKLDLAKFKGELLTAYKIPAVKVDELLKEKMEPAEILLAAKISSIAKKPLELVVTSYKTNKSKGWGYIAKEMGIKPGSPEFHSLKNQSKGNGKDKSNKGKGNSKGKNK